MNPRVPPSSPRSETGVVGCLLYRPALLADVLDTGLLPEDFYRPAWGRAFAAVLSLSARGDAIDAVTVDAELGETEGRPDMADLLGAGADVPSLAHAVTYAERVHGAARLRRVLAACAEVTERAFDPASRKDVDGFTDWAERTVMAATERADAREDPAPLAEVLDRSIAELRSRASGEQVGIPTGFLDLDRMTGGLRSGQLIVLGARPSVGKSALALDVALHVARTSGPVLFVSAEMGALELGSRVLSGGGVASDKLLTAKLDNLDFSRLEARRAELVDVPLMIDDSPGSTLGTIRARARRQVSRGGLALLIVDYLQLIDGDGNRERREQEVAAVSRGLKALARELHVPVLAVAQLNRAVELRADKRPVLADLRDSGQLEQDADLVTFLYRPGVYDLDADPGETELAIAKHRNGPTGIVHLVWLPSRMTFKDAAPIGAGL